MSIIEDKGVLLKKGFRGTMMESQRCDSYDQINLDTLILTDKVRDIKRRIRETPWYRLRTHLRLYKELRNFDKQADEIRERLKRIKENPIQIIRRT